MVKFAELFFNKKKLALLHTQIYNLLQENSKEKQQKLASNIRNFIFIQVLNLSTNYEKVSHCLHTHL